MSTEYQKSLLRRLSINDSWVQKWFFNAIAQYCGDNVAMAIAGCKFEFYTKDLPAPTLLVSYVGDAVICHTEFYSTLVQFIEVARKLTGVVSIVISGCDGTWKASYYFIDRMNQGWRFESLPGVFS